MTDTVMTDTVMTDTVMTDTVMTDTVMIDAVMTDAVMIDAVMIDAVMTDAVPSEPVQTYKGPPLLRRPNRVVIFLKTVKYPLTFTTRLLTIPTMKKLSLTELIEKAHVAELDSFKIANGMRLTRSNVTDAQRKKALDKNVAIVDKVEAEIQRRIDSSKTA